MASRAEGRRAHGAALRHEGFLRHRHFRWAKIAAGGSAFAVIVYALHDPSPRPGGGTWYGYTLGTIGALLILWLAALGIRKRRMTPGAWSLKAWTSAHVYLGLSLLMIGTLHTGFQFGYNVHTLAYALMILVIVSGLFGVLAYATLPRALSENRGELTEAQMLDNLGAIDRQLHDAAQPLDQIHARLIDAALREDAFAGGLRARLTGRDRIGPTRRARDRLGQAHGDAAVDKVEALLDRKLMILDQIQRHLRIRALLEIWLYVHVPVTIALIAALAAHIVSVFFYW
ncbi:MULTISPECIES: hypothetical protein [unclassified Sphingomonas]|uniref:hypothetical protein n=1 Tax=unclassified Sphingomonas TaxID=196159 RepID=UPI00226AAAD1|nr:MULTISPECIES: hypothetical protein [unclassified Sphingomonas]